MPMPILMSEYLMFSILFLRLHRWNAMLAVKWACLYTASVLKYSIRVRIPSSSYRWWASVEMAAIVNNRVKHFASHVRCSKMPMMGHFDGADFSVVIDAAETPLEVSTRLYVGNWLLLSFIMKWLTAWSWFLILQFYNIMCAKHRISFRHANEMSLRFRLSRSLIK